MSNFVLSETQRVEALNAFHRVCSPARLEALVGKGNDKKFLSDFYLICEKHLNRFSFENVAKCCVEIASLKLSILTQAGQAYVVPRKMSKDDPAPVLVMEVGYKGWLLLAKRAGIAVKAIPIFKDDLFEYELTSFVPRFRYQQGNFDYVNSSSDEIHQNLIGILVITRDLVSGLEDANLVPLKMLQKLRSKSSSANSPAYREWLVDMYRAKAIKYVLKRMPIDTTSGDIFNAFKNDDLADMHQENAEIHNHTQTQAQANKNSQDLNALIQSGTLKKASEIKPVHNEITGEVIEENIDDDNPFADPAPQPAQGGLSI